MGCSNRRLCPYAGRVPLECCRISGNRTRTAISGAFLGDASCSAPRFVHDKNAAIIAVFVVAFPSAYVNTCRLAPLYGSRELRDIKSIPSHLRHFPIIGVFAKSALHRATEQRRRDALIYELVYNERQRLTVATTASKNRLVAVDNVSHHFRVRLHAESFTNPMEADFRLCSFKHSHSSS